MGSKIFGFYAVKMLEIPVNQAHLVYQLMCMQDRCNPS